MDVGSTTTDIVPIKGGRLACEGRSDLTRLSAGELVYTGVLRTNPNTLTTSVPVRGRPCRVAAEYFAVMADVYVLLGRLDAADYTCPTPDGRDSSPAACAERLARLVCADREMLSEPEILAIARYLVECQLRVVSEGLLQVVSRRDAPPPASRAGRRRRLPRRRSRRSSGSRGAPRRKHLGERGHGATGGCRGPAAGSERGGRRVVIDAVVKVGGSLGRGTCLPALGERLVELGRRHGCWWCRAAASSPTR